MKLLLTSVDALIDNKTGKMFPGLEKELDYYLGLSKENCIVTISIRKPRLAAIPAKYNPSLIASGLRGSDKLFPFLSKQLKREIEDDVIILGAKQHDMFCAHHHHCILLTAWYAEKNNPDEVIYKGDYGIPMYTTAALGVFFGRFYGINNPWYYKVDVDKQTTLYALTDATSFNRTADEEKILAQFKECLKKDNAKYVVPFVSYFLVCTHQIMSELDDIDYWDIYPSSKPGEVKQDLLLFAKKAAHSFGTRFRAERLLIRTSASQVRHHLKKDKRLEAGCDNQFDTLKLNDWYKGKLQGKTVCIIDDYTTYGSSLETVRSLLIKEGVARVIFIALGKFGRSDTHYRFDYTLTGDPYVSVKYKRNGTYTAIQGEINKGSNAEFLTSLAGLS